MTITSINALLLRRGGEGTLLPAWRELEHSLSRQPGFRSGVLLRATSGAFSHVGLLTFEDSPSYEEASAQPAVRAAWQGLDRICIVTPGLFEPMSGIVARQARERRPRR